jgi:hypothetical protein
MTDPKRLLEGGTELEARLLASALEDAPGRGLERRVQVAVGIGGIAMGAGTASTTAAAAASKAIPLLSLGVAKWVGIVAIGTGAMVGAAVIVRPEVGLRHAPVRSVSPTRPTGAPGAAVGPAMTAPPPNAAQPWIPPIPPIAISPPAPHPATLDRAGVPSTTNHPQALAASPSAVVPTETTTDLLVSELAMLDSAHKALDSGDTQLALATLDRHDLEFAHGDLAPESLVLRIEAYAQRRDDVKVRELGQSFLSRYPAHPQSGRVQLLMHGSVPR